MKTTTKHMWPLLLVGILFMIFSKNLSAQEYAVVTTENGYVTDDKGEVIYKVPYFSLIEFSDVRDSKAILSAFDGKYGIRLGQVFAILELSKQNVNRPLNANNQRVMIDAIVKLRDAFKLSKEEKYAEAIKKGEDAATTLGLLFFADPSPSPYEVWFEAQIAYFEYASGDLEAANKRLDKAERILKNVKQKNPVQASDLYNVRGLVRTDEGKPKEAISLFHKAISISEHTLGKNHMDVGSILQNLSFAHEALGDFDKALETQDESMEYIHSILPKSTVELPAAYTRLGDLLLASGKAGHALKAYEIALTDLEKNKLDDDQVETANARLGFFDAMTALENFELAEIALDIGLRNEVAKMKGKEAAEYEKAYHYRRGYMLYEQDKLDKSMTWLEKARKLHDKKNEDFVDALVMSTIGHIHSYNSDSAKAKKAYQEALDIYTRTEGEDSESAAEVRGWMAD